MSSNADIYVAARKGLVEYRQIFLPTANDVKPADFHYEWSNELLECGGHAAFEGFRESGKGSIILRAFPLYAMTFPDERWRYVVLIKANQAQARKALRGIVTEFLNNPFINARKVKVLKNTADVFEVVLESFGVQYVVLIEAYGKGASIRGLNNKDVRPTIILLDDPQDSSDMNSEVTPDNDWEWFLGDVMFLGQNSRVFLIGNNLGEKCIIERVGKNADALGFKFRRIPCADDALTVSRWPQKQSIEEIKKEREDYVQIGQLDVWLREKMCCSVNEETKLFNESDYTYYSSSLIEKMAGIGTVVATLDPASSMEKTACFRAISVVSVMPDGHWYVLDMPYGRWDSIELIDQMFNVVVKWGVRRFGVEKGMLQQFLQPILLREMSSRNIRFILEGLEHGKRGSKLERISMLQPMFKSRSIWFPDRATWLTELKAELAGVTRTEIKSEFVDLCDSLAMVQQIVTFPVHGYRSGNKHRKPEMAIR